MEQNREAPTARRKHLLTDKQLAPHVGTSAEDLAGRHRPGNGIRVHRTYIVIVSLVALVLLGVAIAVTSTGM